MIFDKKKVLEAILQDLPILSNLKRDVKIKGKKRTLWAYYCNRGVEDPEVKYSRLNPLPTTENSTLCEIYSTGGIKYEELRKDMKKIDEEEMKRKSKERGKNKKSDSGRLGDETLEEILGLDDTPGGSSPIKGDGHYYAGPVVDGGGLDGLTDPAGSAREDGDYEYYHSDGWFADHFNEICKKRGYNIKYDDGRVMIKRDAELIDDDSVKTKVSVIMGTRIDMDTDRYDPTLKEMLDKIEEAYQKLVNTPTPKEVYVEIYDKQDKEEKE